MSKDEVDGKIMASVMAGFLVFVALVSFLFQFLVRP